MFNLREGDEGALARELRAARTNAYPAQGRAAQSRVLRWELSGGLDRRLIAAANVRRHGRCASMFVEAHGKFFVFGRHIQRGVYRPLRYAALCLRPNTILPVDVELLSSGGAWC